MTGKSECLAFPEFVPLFFNPSLDHLGLCPLVTEQDQETQNGGFRLVPDHDAIPKTFF